MIGSLAMSRKMDLKDYETTRDQSSTLYMTLGFVARDLHKLSMDDCVDPKLADILASLKDAELVVERIQSKIYDRHMEVRGWIDKEKRNMLECNREKPDE